MKYKSKNLDFLSNDMKMSNLCFYNEHYYFECDSEIAEAEIVSDEEFAEAVASVVVAEPTEEPTEEELAQAEILLMQSEILANQMVQDEVLAEILLNQMEV